MIELMKGLRRTCIPVMVASLPAFAPVAQAGDAPLAYRMMVIEGEAQADKVISGNYEEAIAMLTARGPRYRNRFDASNNLCVAYAKQEELTKAEQACGDALRNSRGSFRFWYDHAMKSDQAVAFSNRGVIRALSGDLDRAREDFERSIVLNGKLETAADNLARLDATATEALSSL